MACYLFVPGGERTGQDWDQVREWLAARGETTAAITLSDPEQATLDSHVSQVAVMMARMPGPGVILVGHSYAGLVITGAAARDPDRTAGLVYVDAAIPRDNQSLFDIFREAGLGAADFGVPAWPPFVEPLAFDPAVIRPLPKTYIRCLRSRYRRLTAGVVARLAGPSGDENWRFLEMDSEHYPMLDQPRELARLVWAGSTRADSAL